MRGSPGPAPPSAPRCVGVGGWRAQLPVSGWGAFSLHCVCLPFPGAPHPGEGPCMSGGPLPPPTSVCLSVCVFAVCTRLGVLILVLAVNVNGPLLRVPLDTHPCVDPFCSPHSTSSPSSPLLLLSNTRINTHRGSHSTWGSCTFWARKAWLQHPGSVFRHTFHFLSLAT